MVQTNQKNDVKDSMLTRMQCTHRMRFRIIRNFKFQRFWGGLFFIRIYQSHPELQCKKDRKNYLMKHYPSLRKHFWSMKSWTWPSFSTFADPRFSSTKDKHSKPSDKYASLQLHSDIDSVAAFLIHFSSVACYWPPTWPTLFVFTSRLTGIWWKLIRICIYLFVFKYWLSAWI